MPPRQGGQACALVLVLSLVPGCTNPEGGSALDDVETWFYFLSDDLDSELDEIAASSYDLVVMDPIVTNTDRGDYDVEAAVARVKGSAASSVPQKIVLAYVDIGQAESYRYYWRQGWRVGDPAWIAGGDPDLWEDNYPVAYWDPAWQAIWFEGAAGFDAQINIVVAAGFDGVYLDWVEAYSDENVLAIAMRDGVDPVLEMKRFVAKIRDAGKALDPGFLVVGQNAAELVEEDDYAASIDGLAQEQVWFDGSAFGDPEGDCPLPRTDDDVESEAYVSSLSPGCRRMHDELPDGTLHVSSESYLVELEAAQERGLPVFTVDYALEPRNVEFVYETARAYGFVPFVSNRPLDRFFDPHP